MLGLRLNHHIACNCPLGCRKGFILLGDDSFGIAEEHEARYLYCESLATLFLSSAQEIVQSWDFQLEDIQKHATNLLFQSRAAVKAQQ